MTESDYTFTCPSCAGSFSVLLERIPPVRARFRCPHCDEPMDFPSREEARVSAQPPAPAAVRAAASVTPEATRTDTGPFARDSEGGTGKVSDETRFRLEKPGFETDAYDRRSVRNLIRTGEILEGDRVRVDNGEPVMAGDLSYLRSLFSLRKTTHLRPPKCCRTHTDQIAFFQCRDTSRPLCEECAPEKKFGGTSIRVCQHCGGTAVDLHMA